MTAFDKFCSHLFLYCNQNGTGRCQVYYELYIDVFFCVNLSMDLLVLYIMKRRMKLPGSMLALVAASAYGAGIISCYLLFPSRGRPGMLALFWILAGAGMIRIAFGPSDVKNMAKRLILFYVVNLFLNGAANHFFFRSWKCRQAAVLHRLYVSDCKGSRLSVALAWEKR